jgi:hypothetical protein
MFISMLLYSTTPLFCFKKVTKVPDRGSYVWDPCAEERLYRPDLNQSTITRYMEKRLVSSSIQIFSKEAYYKSL